MSMNDELWIKAAYTLAGYPVSVRFRQPICLDYDGQAYIIGGVPTIDIKPNLDDETTLYILTHECGHIRLGHAPEIDPGQLPGSQKLTALGTKLRQIHPVMREQETGADRLSSVWLDYARKHAREYPGDSDLAKKLKALASYISPELQLRVNKAALKGAGEAVEFVKWKIAQEKLTDKGK
jgi:hypothetical protein